MQGFVPCEELQTGRCKPASALGAGVISSSFPRRRESIAEVHGKEVDSRFRGNDDASEGFRPANDTSTPLCTESLNMLS